MKFFVVLICIGFYGSRILATENNAALHPREAKLVVAIVGTGTVLSWSFGVLKALYENVPAVRAGKIILTANSGGAFLASYLACHGLSDESLRDAERLLYEFPRENLDDDIPKKKKAYFKGTPVKALQVHIDDALNDTMPKLFPQGVCQPKIPLMLTASNEKILATGAVESIVKFLVTPPSDKQVFLPNYFVYQNKNASFVNLGKPCTYFVDESLLAVLREIPYEQIQCNLKSFEISPEVSRVFGFTSSSGLENGMLGTSAEPGLAFPVEDILAVAVNENIDLRKYPDHFVKSQTLSGSLTHSTSAIQDLRRAMPHLYAVSTGKTEWKEDEDMLARRSFLIGIVPTSHLSNWWYDMIVPIDDKLMSVLDNRAPEEKSRIFKLGVEHGHNATLNCLANDCRPTAPQTREPYFSFALKDTPKDFAISPARPLPQKPAPNMPRARGLKALL